MPWPDPGAALYPELAELGSSREALAPVSGDALTQVRIALAVWTAVRSWACSLYLRHADVQMPAARKARALTRPRVTQVSKGPGARRTPRLREMTEADLEEIARLEASCSAPRHGAGTC
ncbi:hypothetical protein [Actinomyces viscosus]|uniref:Uncharacterized protein n=1 Tax=Actinomyces viscosus TaxID=1656 RepID=A0A448PGV7_ACTVI|nr:hypothetical protein [Actinomyces viscosus]VEI14148.1 Uncharacterised protein [Actinomyces viscosus]